MQIRWYPIINYEKCTECLQCVEFCPHGVFTVENGMPIVSAPEKCVEFCRGCQKGACEFEAISFPGDEPASGVEIDCECNTSEGKTEVKKEGKNG